MIRRLVSFSVALLISTSAVALEYDDESVDSCVSWFEGLRKAKYQWAVGEITTINFFRAKIIGLEHGMKKIVQAAREVKKHCLSASLDLDTCINRQDTAYSAIKTLQTHVYLIQTSRSFQENLNKVSPNSAVIRSGIERLVSDHQWKLMQLAGDAEKAREKLGALKAQAEFQRFLAEQKEKDEDSRLKVVCQLRPAILQREFTALQSTKPSSGDPFALIDSHQKSKGLLSDMQALEEKCGRQSTFNDIRKSLQVVVSKDPYKSLPDFFSRACAKLGASPLKKICARKEINDFTLAAIHSVLSAGGSK